jgi:hypothetical protein
MLIRTKRTAFLKERRPLAQGDEGKTQTGEGTQRHDSVEFHLRIDEIWTPAEQIVN